MTDDHHINDFDKVSLELALTGLGVEEWTKRSYEDRGKAVRKIREILAAARSSWCGDLERSLAHVIRERDTMFETLTEAQESGSKAVFRLQGQIIARDRAIECIERALKADDDETATKAARECRAVLVAAGIP